jgi:hypothetical protein
MPTINFLFEGGVTYSLNPENYLFNYSDFNSKATTNTYCTGVTHWDKDEILLGTTWMHNHDIIFDMQENRIGFAPSFCSGKNVSVVKEKIYIEKSDAGYYRKILHFVVGGFSLIILFLLLALRKLRRGQQFLWMTVSNSEEAVNKNDVSMIIERNVMNN